MQLGRGMHLLASSGFAPAYRQLLADDGSFVPFEFENYTPEEFSVWKQIAQHRIQIDWTLALPLLGNAVAP